MPRCRFSTWLAVGMMDLFSGGPFCSLCNGTTRLRLTKVLWCVPVGCLHISKTCTQCNKPFPPATAPPYHLYTEF